MRVSPSFASVGQLVIAHRGASGDLPEQTIEAFDLAVDQGADAIELDVVPTRDGMLLARHENELSATTDVADHSRFASRRRTKSVDGGAVTGWFTEDFAAAEVRELRARQRYPFRDHSRDDRFLVPTLDDVLGWRAGREGQVGRPIDVFVEIKHPGYFADQGFHVADLLLDSLARDATSDSGVVIMSFDPRVLRELRPRTPGPLVQLLDAPTSRPFGWTRTAPTRTYADLLTPAGLAEVALYANGIGPWKGLIVPTSTSDATGSAAESRGGGSPTSLVTDARGAGLSVYAWTFRDEPRFLAAEYAGDPVREYRQYFDLHLDGVITDFPRTAVAARNRK